MGGRGTFASGNNVEFTYETVSAINDVKVLRPIDKTKSLKLPEESHGSNAYILLDSDGVFKQMRIYNDEKKVIADIDYHSRYKKEKELHIHVYNNPGIENRIKSHGRKLTKEEFVKYKKFFKGVV